jgi:putative DNA primase/helicase
MTEKSGKAGDEGQYIKSGLKRKFSELRSESEAGKRAAFIISRIPEDFDIYRDYDINETHQAQAIIDCCGRWMCYCPEIGWLVYHEEDGCWKEQYAEAAVFAVVEHFAHLRFENAEDDAKEQRFCTSMLSASGLMAVMRIIKNDQRIIQHQERFDRRPELLNCKGEVYDLKAQTSRPAEPEDYLTKSTRTRVWKSEGGGEAPLPRKFLDFIGQITSKDGEARMDLAHYLLFYFGYALSGDMGAGFFVNFHGQGRNGKSALLSLMLDLFGDYGAVIPEDLVLENPRASGFDLSEIPGIRLGVVADATDGHLNMKDMKPIITGDPMSAKRKYRDNLQFRPVCKIAVGTNNRLKLRETGLGVQRRIRMVPFDYTIPEEKVDVFLKDKLLEEAPLILALLLKGAYEYYQKGGGPRAFPACAVVDAASREYMASEDQVAQFLEEKTEAAEGAQVAAADLYKNYLSWCDEQGIRKKLGKNSFGDRLTARKIERKSTGTVRLYLGIRLRLPDG